MNVVDVLSVKMLKVFNLNNFDNFNKQSLHHFQQAKRYNIFNTFNTFNISMDFNYERLEVAKSARLLINDVYRLTESFPAKEMYGLVNQIRRAVVSVLLNLAEGSCKESKKDFNKFVRISIGSLVEVDCALKISIDLTYITNMDYDKLEPRIKELYFKLIGLSKYLISTTPTP